MKKQKFFYVLVDKALSSLRLAKTQTNLFELIKESPGSDIKAFESLEEAQKYMNLLKIQYPSNSIQSKEQAEEKNEETSKFQTNEFQQKTAFPSTDSSMNSLLSSIPKEKRNEKDLNEEEKSQIVEEQDQDSNGYKKPYDFYCLFKENE